MLIPLNFLTRERGMFNRDDYEESLEHAVFTERLRKTLYYGKTPTKDRPSLPVTELAVGFLQDAAPRKLGKVDLSLASGVSHEACISPCSLMLGMIYVERLKHRNPDYLQQVSSSDLFLISMMMASKYLYDEGVDEEVFNDEWAESADMDVDELNLLERDFLRAIDWHLFVKPADFFSLLERIERSIAYTKCKERGFHTYTDLLVLSQHGPLNQAFLTLLAEISKVMAVCCVAYLAGVMTMMGSAVSLVYLQQAVHQVTLPTRPVLSPHHHIHTPKQGAVEDIINGSVLGGPGDEVRGQGVYRLDSLEGLEEGPSTDRRRRPGDEEERSKVGLPFSGLIALTLIKDTVLQFVVGINSQQRLPDSSRADSGGGRVVCTCGCCPPPTNNKQCFNISLNDGQYFGHTWSVYENSRTHVTWTRMDCDEDGNHGCCCTPRGQRLQWQHVTGSDSMLDVPFHNVVLGFGTTAEPLITE